MHAHKIIRDRWAYLALLAMATIAGFCNLNIKALSVFDEVTYLGYVQFVTDGHVARNGDILPSWPRYYVTCLPVMPNGMVTKLSCGDINAAPANYPFGSTRVAVGWPPVYFGYAAAVVKALEPFGVDHLIAARLASLVLFTAGTFILLSALRRFGASDIAGVAAILMLWAAPSGDLYSRFVTPHSAVPLLIGLSLLAAARRVKAGKSLKESVILQTMIALLTAITVPQALFGCLAIVMALAVYEAIQADATMKMRCGAVAYAVTVFAALGAWKLWLLYIHSAVGLHPEVTAPAFSEAKVEPTIGLLQRTRDYALYFWPNSLTGDPNMTPLGRLAIAHVAALFVVMAGGSVLLDRLTASFLRILVLTSLAAVMLAGVVFSFQLAFSPQRYAYSLAVIGFFLFGIALKERRWAIVLAVVAAMMFAYAIYNPSPRI